MICKDMFRIKKDGEPYRSCYCKDITKIENYSKAVLDTTQTWECHHRLETHYLEKGKWVRREQEVSVEQLIEDGKYFDVPPEELIFLTHAEHSSLHKEGKNLSEEHKRKISKTLKGQKRPEGSGTPPKKVQCVETGEIFESLSDAQRKTGVSNSNIGKVCNGSRMTAGGYHWKYYEP